LKVTATVEPAGVDWPERRERALAALRRLAARGGSEASPIQSPGSASNAKSVRCRAGRHEAARSNILIYAAESGQEALRERILAEPAGVPVATMVGGARVSYQFPIVVKPSYSDFRGQVVIITMATWYHLLTRDEESDLRALLNEPTVFSADIVVAERAVTLRQQRKMGLGDANIAATALVHQCPLVTRNVDDFKHIAGHELEKPFKAKEDA
jgi:hypothetical protein